MQHKWSTQGFTLIELIAVIVILGVLAAVAAPKFTDLSSAARAANVTTMKRAIESGTKLLFGRAVIQNKIQGADTLTVDGKTYNIHSGYLQARAVDLGTYLEISNVAFATDAPCPNKWCIRGNAFNLPSGISGAPGRIAKIYPRGKTWNEACGVYYINRLNGSTPEIGIVSADC